MHRCVRVAVFLLTVVFVAALGAADIDRPPLLLLADQDYPPLSYRDRGTPSGMDVDVARALSRRLGRDIRVEVMDWGVAQEKVLKGEADGLLSMTMSPERQARFDFTDSTITQDFGIFVRRGDLTIHGRGDLAGKRIGVTRGGLSRRVLEAEPSLDLVFIDNYEDGFDRLAAGSLDAVAADRWVGAYTIERRGLANIVATGPPFATLPGGIAVRKGQRALVNDLDAAVRALKSDGTLAQIQERWRPQAMLFVSRQQVQSRGQSGRGRFPDGLRRRAGAVAEDGHDAGSGAPGHGVGSRQQPAVPAALVVERRDRHHRAQACRGTGAASGSCPSKRQRLCEHHRHVGPHPLSERSLPSYV